MEHQIASRISQLDLPSVLWVILLVAAPFVGSFIGLLAQRIPRGRGVVFGRSHCDRCGHVLNGFDLVPLASWLWLKGKCRYCGEPIGYFPMFMEVATFAVAAWAATETSGWILAASCLFGWWILLLAVIDWREFLLPDLLTLPLAVVGIAISYGIDRARVLDHLIGAVAGFLVFAALGFIYSKLRKREGLGLGDAKLMAALGAWLSWQALPSVLLFAAVGGLIFVLLLSVLRKPLSSKDPIPFGAFLALAGGLVWLYGPLMAP